MYGKLFDEPIEDMRRLFETNLWLGADNQFEEGFLALLITWRHRAGNVYDLHSRLSLRKVVVENIADRCPG